MIPVRQSCRMTVYVIILDLNQSIRVDRANIVYTYTFVRIVFAAYTCIAV